MAKKLFFKDELNETWRNAREKGIENAKGRGHKPSSLHNDKKDMLYAASEMQDIGCMDPANIDQAVFNRWREYTMSDANRSKKAITESGFKKRKEALILLLEANDLNGPLKVVRMHRSDIRQTEFVYWSPLELDAMSERAIEVFETESKKRVSAIAHIIHIVCPPRRNDTASIKWDYFDLDQRILLFPAKKNGKQPGNLIEERFVPILREWKEETSNFDEGGEYLFPSSMAHRSGTTKKKRAHITGKMISEYLNYIQTTTHLPDGSQPKTLSSQKYRRSFAMRALNEGCSLEYVAKVLGDSVETVEKYYCRYIINQAHRREFEKMNRRNTRISSEGSAQPKWMSRHTRPLPNANEMAIAEGFRLHERNRASVYGSGGMDASENGGRWGI